MEFVILGSTALSVDGQDLPLGSAKQRGLLAVLLYHVGTPVRIDAIVEHLWERRTVEDCRPNLYALASRTRAALRAVGQQDALIRVPSISAYRLNIDPQLIDYHQFRHLVRVAREAAARDRHDESIDLLTRGIELWRGEPIADVRGPRSETIRRSMSDAFLSAHKLLAGSRLKTEQYEAVLAQLEPVIETHDLDEALARIWISALHSVGRSDDARTFAINFRQRFRKVMRIDSSIELIHPRPASTGVRSILGRRPVLGEDFTDVQAVPDQLPRDISDFAGRTELLAKLDDLTDVSAGGASVVILGGMPGAGKTTLATHWAHQQHHRFPDGQLYLNGEAYGPTTPTGPGEALGRFLYALGLTPDRIPAGVEQRRERFNQILNNRRVLILLDNMVNSDQVRPLIPTSKSCVTIITSRNRLKSLAIRDGVHGITVSPLSDDESLSLLGQVIGPERAAREPGGAAALARLSGGLPLALRIIGEHVAERPLARVVDLVEELTAHLLDCEGGDDEDATLRNVFAWSYNALDAPVARLFRMVGLYPGRTISATVAGVLLGTDKAAAERILNTLARAHLVNHDTAARYRCHDLIRLYAEDRMNHEDSPEKRHETLRRLLDWYLLSAVNAAALLAPQRPPVPDLPSPDGIEPLTFNSGQQAMAWCESERANLRAMVRTAAEAGFHRHAWQIPGASHETYERYGRQNDVLEIHQIAVAAAEADGHDEGQIGSLNNLGTTYFAIHDYANAQANFNAALELSRAKFPRAEGVCSHNVASVYLKTGDAETAIQIYQGVLRLCLELSDLAGQASTLHRMGEAYRRTGRHDTAALCYLEALHIRERLGSLRGQATTHGQLAALYLDDGQPRESLRHCALAMEIHANVKDEANRCDTLTTAADAHRAVGQNTEAVRDAARAVAIGEEIADSQRQARALAVLADTLVTLGDIGGAQRSADHALAIVSDVDDPEIYSIRARLLATRAALAPHSAAG